jgi:hypothetical protein
MSGSENNQTNSAERGDQGNNQDNMRDQAAQEQRLAVARERAEAARVASAREQEKEAEMRQERDRGGRER